MVAEIKETHGRVNALVLNAGMSGPASLEEMTPDHFDRHSAVNVRTAMLAIRTKAAVASHYAVPCCGIKNATPANFRPATPVYARLAA